MFFFSFSNLSCHYSLLYRNHTTQQTYTIQSVFYIVGREYLNDVHALHVPTMTWRKVSTTGDSPQRRANHSSCILEETGELFVFGGWNGTTRLNDIHILNTATCNWTCPKINGVLPHPRAGMTLTALRGRLYLFGGSGTSSKCFQDLQILDREGLSWNWLDVTQFEAVSHTNNNSNNNHHHRSGYEMHHPSYHRRNQFGFPPLIMSSQHYYNTHHHQQQHHQHHQHRHQNHTLANQQDNNGYQPPPPNPQWNFGGQGYYEYDGHHQYHHSNNHMMNNSSHPRAGSFTSSRADWTSRESAARPRSMGTVVASPNPNDEDTAPTVLLHGIPPGSRAGHTATAVNRKMYVFGGSCGSDYLNDFYVLDTDPPPRATVTEATSSHLIERRLRHFFNDEEFSDVTFLVQERKVYGHKMVLAMCSDCFRAMFTAGFRECSSSEIEITGCSYDAFLAVMEYIYTGANPNPEIPGTCTSMMERNNNNNNNNSTSSSSLVFLKQGIPCFISSRLGKIVDILELADRFFLDHLKQVCETQLQSNVEADTAEYLLQVAQKANAMQLQAICEHYIRNQNPD